MTTLERVRSLRNKFESVNQAEGEQLSLEHLRTLTEQLRGPIDGLERHLYRCRALGISVEGVEGLSEKLERLRAQYSEAPQDVGQGTTFAEFKEGVVHAVRTLQESADERWEDVRSKTLESVSYGLIDFWESIPHLADHAKKLREDVSMLEASSKPPADAKKCEAFLQACTRIRERREHLMEFEAPVEVRKFVIAATSTRGASWQSLTDEVRRWLSENDMLDKLRLRL